MSAPRDQDLFALIEGIFSEYSSEQSEIALELKDAQVKKEWKYVLTRSDDQYKVVETPFEKGFFAGMNVSKEPEVRLTVRREHDDELEGVVLDVYGRLSTVYRTCNSGEQVYE